MLLLALQNPAIVRHRQKLTQSQQQFSILHPLSIRIVAAGDADAADGARPEIH